MKCHVLSWKTAVKSKLSMPDYEHNTTNLAETSSDNADEGGIIEDIPTNQQHGDERESEIQDSDTIEHTQNFGDTIMSNDTQNRLTNKDEHGNTNEHHDVSQTL